MNMKNLIIALKPQMVCRPVAMAPSQTGVQIDWDNAVTPTGTGAITSMHEHSEPINGLIDGKESGGRVFVQVRVAVRDTEANGNDLKWAVAVRNKGETDWCYLLDNMDTTQSSSQTISAVGATVQYDVISGWVPTVAGFNYTNFEFGLWVEEQGEAAEDQEVALVNATVIEANYIPSL